VGSSFKIFGLLLQVLLVAAFSGNGKVYAQHQDVCPGKTYDGLNWNEFTHKLMSEYGIQCYFQTDTIPVTTISVQSDTTVLLDVLNDNLNGYGVFAWKTYYGDYILTRGFKINSFPSGFFSTANEKTTNQQFSDTLSTRPDYLATADEYIWREANIGNKRYLGSKTVILSGKVLHKETGAGIVGANLFIEELRRGTTTDNTGHYSIDLPAGKYILKVSSIDSKEIKYKLNLNSEGTLDILLEPRTYLLHEVEIKSDKNRHIRGTQMGIEKLSVKSIKEIPVVLGEKDINKVALLLPGIQSMGEGSQGFNIRGSPSDQNLFYIENVPVYNTSHLFGFFSAFNSEAINDFIIYKSNIPIEYGGRLASIFRINARNGKLNRFNLSGGISPVTSNLLFEGPLKKDKGSFLVAGRSTYSDWILGTLNDPDIRNSKAGFYDGLMNFSFQLTNKNHVSVFAYGSNDRFRLSDIINYNYFNAGGSLAWRYVADNKNSLGLNIVHSRFGFSEENNEVEIAAFSQDYNLSHSQLNFVFNFHDINGHKIKIGLNSALYKINRGDYNPLTSKSVVLKQGFEPEQALETSVFAGDTWEISNKLSVEAGLRLNSFVSLGPDMVFKYLPYQPVIIENITDSVYYGNNSIVQHYFSFDYRLAASYVFTEDFSVKAGINKLHQHIFLLSNTITISPNAIWKLCDYYLEPMSGIQYSIGMYKNLLGGGYELSMEAYLKKVKNLVEYKDGAEFALNAHPETDIIQGNLTSYGLEFMVRKNYDRFTGWVNYTFSRAKVLAVNEINQERNNNGQEYFANYDKPHSFNLVAKYALSKRYYFSGNVVYSTGRPITIPSSIYYQNQMEVTQYSLRNEYRLPDYFRIDASFTIEGNLKRNKLFHGSLVFSVYNLTGRRNAYSVFFRNESGHINAYKLSVFGVPIFSVSYNFKLGSYNE